MKSSFSSKLFRLALVLSIILVSVYMFINSAFFSIDKITYTGLNQLSQDEIAQLCKFKIGANIFRINSEIYAKDFVMHPMVRNVTIIKHIPRHIEVRIEERVTWAVVPYMDKFLLIDSEGYCIDQAVKLPPFDYPIITLDIMPQHIYLGQPLSSRGIDFVKKVWEVLTPASRGNTSDFHFISEKEELIVYTLRGTEVRFGDLERLEEKAAFLDQLIKIEDDLQYEGREVLKYIDLRFKGQPVIKIEQ